MCNRQFMFVGKLQSGERTLSVGSEYQESSPMMMLHRKSQISDGTNLCRLDSMAEATKHAVHSLVIIGFVSKSKHR